MNGICELCKKTADLQLSHIVPKFVWRWFKETAPGGIRTNRNPNLRIQDGPKIYLLCAGCEQRLSDWEKPFYENIFLPLHSPDPVTKPVHYKRWALKFAVSVSWRVLVYFEHEKSEDHFSSQQKQLTGKARETWRQFLLDEMDDPGDYNQHLLPLDVIKDYEGPQISPFLNRYFLRSVHIDMISTHDSAYVYTKMCRLVLFGRIQEERPKLWKGMQLHLSKGEIRPRDYHIPGGIADYLNQKADEANNALESISPRQQDVIDATFEKNLDALANSEVLRAMNYDVAHSGEDAFSKRKSKSS